MVTLFTSPSCTSCRKAKAWLQEHDIPYTERNIFSAFETIKKRDSKESPFIVRCLINIVIQLSPENNVELELLRYDS